MGSKNKIFSKFTTQKISQLARLKIDAKEIDYFTNQFNETLEMMKILDKIDTQKIPPTSHVVDVGGVFREDKVDKSRCLSKDEVFKNTKNKFGDYFIVKGILDEE